MTTMGFSLLSIILSLAILNTLIAIYIFTLVPEFLLRFVVWIAIHTIYRVKKTGLDNIPENGPGLIVCNHVSFIDALIIFGSIRRPVKFVMYYKIFEIPILNYIFKAVGAIPIASKQENLIILENAYSQIETYLKNEELVVIFPEGAITKDGKMAEFKAGIIKILKKTPVPIIPSALTGLYGSMYSRKTKNILRFFPKTFLNRKVGYNIGKALSADTELLVIQKEVKNLL